MRIPLKSVEFDSDVKGPGAKADGADSLHQSTHFAQVTAGPDGRPPRYLVRLEYDVALQAIRITHPTAKDRKEILVPFTRVVAAEVLDLEQATAPATPHAKAKA